MPKKLLRTASLASIAAAATFVMASASCNKAQPDAQNAVAAAAPQPVAAAPAVDVQVQPTVVVQDDYVYYPAYEVYYSSRRHDYRYRDGSVWVTRPAPPRVSVNVLLASPSVRVDFHDAPERHHESVAHNYPRNWAPPVKGRDGHDDRKDDRKDKR
jgi:hypothetical protein